MLNQRYPARFEDAKGTADTVIHNDGSELGMVLRGIALTASDFDSFSPADADLERASALFTIHQGELCSYRLSWTMPLAVVLDNQVTEAPLTVTLVVGAPLPSNLLDRETLRLELRLPSGTLQSSGTSGWFEDELLDLARQMGNLHAIRSCITCAFSDYSPHGHGLFGDLACFRDAKEAYGGVRGKFDLFRLWDLMTEFVQETYLCEQYSPRVPGTGYRG